ncbi:MAG: DUF222 domain-containing protein, partial [Actinoplanes sp.]
MEDRLEPLLAARPWAMPPEQIVAELDILVPWMVQAQAALLARVRELDAQAIYRHDGATSAPVWLRNRYLMSLGTARGYVKLAAALDAAPEPVQEAVAEGEVNLEQADVIVKALHALPHDIGPDLRTLAGKELVRWAADLDPDHLRTAGEAILRAVDPDAADDAERTALERAEANAHERRSLTLTPDRTGTGVRLTGLLTNEGAATVRAAIEPLCSPARRDETTPADTRTATQRR